MLLLLLLLLLCAAAFAAVAIAFAAAFAAICCYLWELLIDVRVMGNWLLYVVMTR